MFVGERCFEGTRTFSTQGIDKAILNLFRMYAALGSEQLQLTSTGARDPLTFADKWGDDGGPTIDGIATHTRDGRIAILVFSHHDNWNRDGSTHVELTIGGLPAQAGSAQIEHFRIDAEHSNAYAEWVRQQRPMYPDAPQRAALKARDQLELLGEPFRMASVQGHLTLAFDMPIRAISLVVITPQQL
jgi:xylan 1,4-beta-xylosidase